MNDKYEKQMKKGVLDMLVLKMMEEEPKYGYQIIQEIREKSAQIFSLKDGTLYPIFFISVGRRRICSERMERSRR